MMTPDDRKFIKEEIARQVNIILSGQAGANTVQTETIENLFPAMPSILRRPVMHPYGLVSRAPRGTLSVTARQGEHAGNRLVLGHRDKDKPQVAVGEVQLYNQFGQAIYLKNGSVHLGVAAASNPAVVGNELKAMLQELLTLLANHTHIGNVGAPTSPPIQSGQFTSIKSGQVDNNNILSQLVFLQKGV
jgi:hypothetical protein